jgi:hypothetical protein
MVRAIKSIQARGGMQLAAALMAYGANKVDLLVYRGLIFYLDGQNST